MDPAPKLTSLPDVPSRAIVSLLPIQQVITTFPLLHARFTPIRESVLKGNQRLVLYIGELREIKKKKCLSQLGIPFAGHLVDPKGSPLNPDSSFYRLHLRTLNQQAVERLSTLMPNLTYLEVAIAQVDLSVLPHLLTLLTFWGPGLQTLSLLIREFKSVSEEHLQRTYLSTVASHLSTLIRFINCSLLALQSLNLDLDDSLVDQYQERLSTDLVCAIVAVSRLTDENNMNVFQVDPIELENAVGGLNLLIHEVADFLDQEPPTEAVNAQETVVQARRLYGPLWDKNRFPSEALFKGDNGEPFHFLSILGQLKTFTFDTGRASPSMQVDLLQSIDRYGSPTLTSIALAKDTSHTWNVAAFARSRFASRFTQFPLQYERGELDDTPFLSLFTSLKVYTLHWSDLGPNQMTRLCALASLPKLQCLQLEGFERETPLLAANFPSLPPFSQVTVLQISFFQYSRTPYQTHDCLVAPYWAHLFPSVQILKLIHRGNLCNSCFPNSQLRINWNSESYEKVLPCVKRLLAPLRALPSIRKIFYQSNAQIEAIAEFTPEGALRQIHKYVY